MGDTGRSLTDILDDFTGFYFDTALSSSAAALPTLLAFAKPGHVTFGSDWPFAPVAAGIVRRRLGDLPRARRRRPHGDRAHQCPRALPRFGTGAPPAAGSAVDQVRHAVSRAFMRGVARLVNAR
jgi:hypothetical protein